MIYVETPNADRLETDLNITRSRLLASIKREMTGIATDLSGDVKAEKLSGQVLNVRSGRLRRSINYKIKTSDTGVEATVGTNVEYARVHEFGFKGSVVVREHLRTAKSGFRSMVRSHSRNVNLPQRSFLRSSLLEMKGEIESRIARVIATSIARGVGGAVE